MAGGVAGRIWACHADLQSGSHFWINAQGRQTTVCRPFL